MNAQIIPRMIRCLGCGAPMHIETTTDTVYCLEDACPTAGQKFELPVTDVELTLKT